MGIYHLHLQNISRVSGRSATGSAAYRSGQALRSAAYRSGGELRGDDDILHDYRAKSDVVHSEIILTEGAPKEFEDRQTLWNFADAKEKRKDARLAKEINVALPTEFDLDEQIEVLHEYIKENFTDKGVIVDFNVHNNGNGNPHAHIMLTTRHVTPDGFGKKNTDLDSRANLIEWRENWARVNNRKFEEKGLDERIDHRTLKAQSIDREPTIHLGHKATALERKGIRTERGDYNREIKRRNAERAQKSEQEKELEGIEANINNEKSTPKNNHGDAERNALMSAKRNMREIENHLKAEKAEQIVEKMRQQRKAREDAKTERRMNALKEKYFKREREKKQLKAELVKGRRERPPMQYRAENMDEYDKNIRMKQKRLTELREEHRNLNFLQMKQKKYLKGRIEQVSWELEHAREDFRKKYHVDPGQAQAEVKRIQNILRTKDKEMCEKEARIRQIEVEQGIIKSKYQTLKLKNDIRRDNEEIDRLLEQIGRHPESVYDRQIREQIEHMLNTVTDEDFQKIVVNLPREAAQGLTELREQTKERERLEGLLKAEKERNRTITRSR